MPGDNEPLLSVRDLWTEFRSDESVVRAVNGVNLTVYPRQTVAVLGESGSGKSVSALSILRLIPEPPGRVVRGQAHLDGVDLLRLKERQMRGIRGGQVAMIFQEPMSSLNPVFTVGWQLTEAIRLHRDVSKAEARSIAEQALRDVDIAEPHRRLEEYPHQLSGGMRQRVMIAMALACEPRLLIADEPTTALDVTIQAQILELLRELQWSRGLSIMLITHDLGVVAENADVVAVMYAGQVVEYGSVENVFERPTHPYTQGLFRSIPRLGAGKRRLETIPGQVPDPARLPRGCPFHPRCLLTRQLASEASGEETTAVGSDAVMRRCVEGDPPLLETRPSHWAACWYAEGHEEGDARVPDVVFRRENVEAASEA